MTETEKKLKKENEELHQRVLYLERRENELKRERNDLEAENDRLKAVMNTIAATLVASAGEGKPSMMPPFFGPCGRF